MIEHVDMEKLEKEVSKQIAAITNIPIYFMGASPTKGATVSEENAGLYMDKRAVRIEITDNDTGCEWAFDNDVSVSNNIQRLCNTLNNGFDVIIPDETKDKDKAKDAKKLLDKRIEDIQITAKTDVMITNRANYSFGILAKRTTNNGDIVGLLELDCHEDRCFPIRNSLTGDLGGETGKGLNPDDKTMEVALIQKGKINKYDSTGNLTTEDKNFYFSREEIIPWTMNDRGKFKSTSPVKRVLRLVEIKKTLENAVILIVRRFGPQVWITVGNESYNLSNTRVPESYMRDSSGNPVDLAVARENYRKAMFDNIEKAVQKWSDGETMVQIAEYGIESKVLTPTSNLFAYDKYIDLVSDYIKVGIFGLDVAGRVDVTSAVMQDRLFRDLKDRARRERTILENIYQRELWNPILVANGFEENLVYVKFKPLDKVELTEEAETERRRSLAVLQYTNAGFDIPQNLQEQWKLVKSVIPKPVTPPPIGILPPRTPPTGNQPPGLKVQPKVKPEVEL